MEGAAMENIENRKNEIKTTKEKIIYESLNLFSKSGYEGVSMRDIAAAVGIKGASIYNHFKGKEDIFHAIIIEMTKRYDMASASIHKPTGGIEEVADFYIKITDEGLFTLAQKQLLFFLKDDFASKFRKMLTMEQYRNKLARNMFKSYFFEMPMQFQTELFRNMIEKKAFEEYDPRVMALHFYGPIYLLLNNYEEDCELEDMLDLIKNHVTQFIKIYH